MHIKMLAWLAGFVERSTIEDQSLESRERKELEKCSPEKTNNYNEELRLSIINY